MAMKNAIKLAIEKGGYANFTQSADWSVRPDYIMAVIVQDPLFWQALGKALGWDKYSSGDGFWGFTGDEEYREELTWKTKAHQHFDLVLTGGDTEKFWKELLKQ